MIILNMYHQPNRSRNSPCRNMLSCRPKGRLVLWPVVCPMPAGGSAVKGRQRGGWLPVAERAGPLTALQTAGTQPGAKWRAQIRTAADRGTPMPRCQGGCHLAGASLKSSTNTSLWGFANAASRARPVRLSRSRDATKRNDCQTEELVVRFSRRKSPQQNRIPAWGCSWNGLR